MYDRIELDQSFDKVLAAIGVSKDRVYLDQGEYYKYLPDYEDLISFKLLGYYNGMSVQIGYKMGGFIRCDLRKKDSKGQYYHVSQAMDLDEIKNICKATKTNQEYWITIDL